MSPLMLFGKSPKFTVVCGECRNTFTCRFDMRSTPIYRVECGNPYCGALVEADTMERAAEKWNRRIEKQAKPTLFARFKRWFKL